jgi:hypothetical protein
MAHRGVGKTSGGGGASIQMLARTVLRRLEVDTQLQGVEREAATCFDAREKHGRGKGRRGCLSGCYELGGERTGEGTGDAATWRRREGGPVGAAWARRRRAAVGHAALSRGAERGGGSGLVGHGR